MEVRGLPLQGNRTLPCFLVVTIVLVFSMQLFTAVDAELVCRNIDIRNSVDNFRKLENCTVIEGFLQILLIDNGTTKEYENLSFHKLREITGYLLLFRANGMTSVGKLFPNLVVIRGSVLFHNFALVIYEMSSLQEVGLHSLTDILRGSVRIDKNGDLCYVETIDWTRIAHQGREGNYIRNNRQSSQCPDTCPSHCPKNPQCPHGQGPWAGDRNCLLCWGSHKCQKVCKECENNNQTCNSKTNKCCPRECLGGCDGNRVSDCLACRNFIFQGLCMESCPKDTFQYLNRRCIDEQQCRKMSETVKWKPFEGKCLAECPPFFTPNDSDPHHCVKCKDKCPKVCPAVIVDNVAAAQSLSGCTTIDGYLDIQIQGGSNIIAELEKNLKDIQEIKGFLKIARSMPLISLNFLKDLRVIHGDTLERDEYALLVLDNQNLQDLWDWKNRKFPLEVKKGKVFFHFNAKLCPGKINDLKNKSHAIVNEWDSRDVSPDTNGFRVPCDVIHMNVSIAKKSNEMVVVSWTNFRKSIHDQRSLLSYVIYYREAQFTNLTIFDGRDACGADVWKVVDEDANPNSKNEMLVKVITGLQPFTQYALYIRTYMTSNADKGAQSPILYFKTNCSTPTPPVNLKAHSADPNEVLVSWQPPKQPNGIITNYTVVVTEKEDIREIVFQRNYCDHVQIPPEAKKTAITADFPAPNGTASSGIQSPLLSAGGTGVGGLASTTAGGQCCSCSSDKKPDRSNKQQDMEDQIQFEDFLHNMVYIKNPSSAGVSTGNRSRRAISSDGRKEANGQTSSLAPFNVSSTASPTPTALVPMLNNKNILRIRNVSGLQDPLHLKVDALRHFTEYAIELKACQEVDPHPPKILGCSLNAITTIRTLPLGGADDIADDSFVVRKENATMGSIQLKWEEPKEPNGLIVSYQIEYRVGSDTDKPRLECISSMQYQESRGFTLTKLQPGNYSLRVRATSLAWPGNWTKPVSFIIPAIPGDSSHEVLWIILPICFIILIAFPFGGYYYFKRKFGLGVPDGILYASVNPEYMSAGMVYEPDEWEVPREKITMLRELGQGSFGMVYEGEAKDLVSGTSLAKCAVKTVNETATLRERIEFLQEASVMKTFDCHHVVKLLGVVSKGHPTLVVMELMASGDLKSYLRSHRPDEVENEGRQPPSLRQILQMAIEIADGMAYLAAKKFVHRDLAARNCMVAEDLTVKIGDFGMTRDIYETDYYRKGGKGLLPVRWMAPESLKDGVFTSQSDVWSYAVVLWEMATLASQPYQGLSNEQVLKYVISGGIMQMPENCPDKLYTLMKLCWQKVPRSRPTFSELIEVLLQDVSEHFREVSFYFNERPKMLAAREDPDVCTIELVNSSTPLKSSREQVSVGSRDNSDEEDELDSVRYFPSSNVFEGVLQGQQCVNGVHEGPSMGQLDLNLSSGSAKRQHVHSNSEGSKGMSLPSSDGSKGSKVSSISNGSLANGHAASVPFPSARTTTC